MVTISLWVEGVDRAELEELAQSRGASLSELLQDAIGGLLGRPVRAQLDDPNVDNPRSMSVPQRRALQLQHEILEVLGKAAHDEHSEQYHRERREVLENGYTTEYYQEFQPILPELPLADCQLVIDILNMFRYLKESLRRLDDAEAAELRGALTFEGFDLNDPVESRLLAYARWMIHGGHWPMLAEQFDVQHEGGNSHIPRLDVYRRMLAAFTPIWEDKTPQEHLTRYELTVDELRTVAEARRY